MKLDELKNKIENGVYSERVLIFVRGKSDSSRFLVEQYKNEILKLIRCEVVYTEDITTLTNSFTASLFGGEIFTVCDTDKLDIPSVATIKNALIICNSVSDKMKKEFADIIITFPELENWHIEDYITSRCEGMSNTEAKDMASKCGYNIFRVANEVDKVALFKKESQKQILKELVEESFCDDLTEHTMFNLVDAIVGRKYKELVSVWKDAHLFDSDPMWLLSLLLGQYKTIIDVFLYPNSTAEICCISQKRFNAIKYYYKSYSKNQLINIYEFLCEVDRKLKFGELSDINLLDYIIVNVIGVR